MADARAATRRFAGVIAVVALVVAIVALVRRSSGEEQRAQAVDERPGARIVDSGSRTQRDSGKQMLAADKASVSGTIRADDGRPIAGATVCAESDRRELLGAGDKLPKCVTSERDGHYRIEGLWPVSTAIHASAPQFMPGLWHERVDGRERYELRLHAGQERREVDIVLPRGGVPVRGVVKDIGGGEIEGAFVTASREDWGVEQPFATARTDADGRFELWTKPGATSLMARADGYAPADTESSAPTELATIFLTPESVLEGTVIHAETGAPVAGVTVGVSRGFFGGRGGDAITDADGRFRIASLTPGIYDLVAHADELYGEGIEQVHLGLGQSVDDVVVEVHPAFAVSGKVVIAETGAACDEGQVTLERVGDPLVGRIGESGEVLVRAVFPGTYRVQVRCTGHVPEPEYDPIVITDANLFELEWKVHTGLAIRGEVVDADSQPVVGVTVLASPQRSAKDPRARQTSSWNMATDERGAFELAGLLPGTYELATWGRDQPRLVEPVIVTLGESADVEGVRLVLPATGKLVGIVRDESGAPVPGVTIRTSSLERFRLMGGSTRTGDDGRFEVAGLEAGSVRVRASVRAAGTTDDDLQGEVVEIVAGGETHVELTVERRTLGIRGRVIDSAGAPVTDAFVDATRMSDSAAAGPGTQMSGARWGWDRRPVLSEQDGSFEITELAEGQYIVRAYRKAGGEGVVEGVRAGSAGVEVTITDTGEISGTVVFVDGGSPERFEILVSDRAQALHRRDDFFRTDGHFALRELPPGNYEVHATAPEGTAKTEVALAAGQSIDDVKIELVGKITVRGRIVDADTREPVPGMTVNVWAASSRFERRLSNDTEREHITDADGRFQIDDVPVGRVSVQVLPRNMGTANNEYTWARRTINLPSDPPVQDLGEIEILRNRLGDQKKPGDLGFTLEQLPPELEPEERYYEVAVIRPGGPADASNLAVGDRIVEVDGHAVTGSNTNYYALIRAPAGTSIVFGIEGGKQVTIVLGPPVQ